MEWETYRSDVESSKFLESIINYYEDKFKGDSRGYDDNTYGYTLGTIRDQKESVGIIITDLFQVTTPTIIHLIGSKKGKEIVVSGLEKATKSKLTKDAN